MAIINGFKDLIVYQKAFKVSMDIFNLTKTFPVEEKYSLTDQIRRSSRSVCANIAEAWAKKIYPKSFINKLTDSLGEEYETEVWLEYSLKCKYISNEDHKNLMDDYQEIRKMLLSMISNPEKFCQKKV